MPSSGENNTDTINKIPINDTIVPEIDTSLGQAIPKPARQATDDINTEINANVESRFV